MPPGLLNAFIDQIAPLRAEESLLTAERVAVGTGSLRKGVGRRITAGWERQTDRQRPKMRARSREQYQALLAGVGIGVKPARVEPDG